MIEAADCDVFPDLALTTIFSRSAMREDMSAMIVFFGRLARGPTGGYSHDLPARVQAVHGSRLSHRIFLAPQL